MNKVIVSLAFVLLLSLCLVVLTACIFSNNSSPYIPEETPEEIPDDVEITLKVVDGEFYKNFNVLCGEKAEVEALYKRGKYLKGYYDAPEGGNKYFDSMGASTVIWSENFPTTYYAQWGELSELPVMELQFYTDKPHSGNPSEEIDLLPEIANAVLGNIDGQIKVTATFERYNSSGIGLGISLRDTFSSGRETFFSEEYTGSRSYKTYNIEAVVPAECGRAGGICFSGYDTSVNLMSSSFTKDMFLTISYIAPSTT